MRQWLIIAIAAAGLVACGCGGGGGDPGDEQPVEVDYAAFTGTLQTGDTTGALVLQLLRGGLPAANVTARIALPGADETEGYTTQSDTEGLIRVGNAPGGTYDVYLSAPGTVSKVVAVTFYAGAIATVTTELTVAPQ